MAILAVLVIVWYLASPLFLDKTVNEELPQTLENDTDNTLESVRQGDFQDADSFHKVRGTATVLTDGEKRYIRFENFEATNGPDLYVYLSNDLDATSYVNLGELKGNIGDQNYEIPAEVDLEEYPYALIWCEQFSVLFGSAELQ